MYISHYILTCLPTDTRQLFSVFIMIIIFKAKEKAFVEGSGYLYIRDLKPRFNWDQIHAAEMVQIYIVATLYNNGKRCAEQLRCQSKQQTQHCQEM